MDKIKQMDDVDSVFVCRLIKGILLLDPISPSGALRAHVQATSIAYIVLSFPVGSSEERWQTDHPRLADIQSQWRQRVR